MKERQQLLAGKIFSSSRWRASPTQGGFTGPRIRQNPVAIGTSKNSARHAGKGCCDNVRRQQRFGRSGRAIKQAGARIGCLPRMERTHLTETFDLEGTAIHMEGEGAETILMVHGWPDTHRIWDAQVAAFRHKYRCVRFTLPGFDVRDERRLYSLQEIEALYRKVIERVSPNAPVILLVHDWGAVFGYRFLRHHPQLVSRVIGVDIGDAGSKDHLKSLSAGGKLFLVSYQWWLALAWRLGPGLGDRMSRAFVRRIDGPTRPEAVLSKMNYPYWIQWTGAAGGYRGAVSPDPACPMLFIYGEKKPAMFHSQAWADGLAARQGSEVTALPAGHWVMTDAPEAFNRTVLAWLSA